MTREEIIGAAQTGGGMFAVMPSVVMRDPALSMSAKLLYGIITWRCNENACCWATNRTLGEDMGLSAKRVSALLSVLEERGHIETEIIRDEETGQILRRNIYPIVKSSRGIFTPDPIPKNEDTPPPENEDTLSPKLGGGIPENGEKNNKEEIININNNPPTPQGGTSGGQKKKRRAKSVPIWQPERFERFWEAYPRDEDRARAVAEWDKLPEDRELMDKHGGSEEDLLHEIAVGLKRHLACEDWRNDVGIPYAFRWLRDRRWTEKQKTGRPAGQGTSPRTRAYHVEIRDGEEVVVYE